MSRTIKNQPTNLALTDDERDAASASLRRYARSLARLMTPADRKALFACFGSAHDARRVAHRSAKTWRRLLVFGVVCDYRVAREHCALTELGLVRMDALRGPNAVRP